MCYWTGLYPEETQKLINGGIDLVMKIAMRLLGKQEDDHPTLARRMLFLKKRKTVSMNPKWRMIRKKTKSLRSEGAGPVAWW
jgi:hypothetical protein